MSKFSKIHYEMIGDALNKMINKPFIDLNSVDRVFEGFSRMFEEDNKRFDYAKFYHRVWIGEEVKRSE